ncbi:hypothetical protein CDAR_113851 [Caerostris darwini]|uniref:Uncharacterized protein n=1 Tax=Caerostris darwini TaxID=1538125 RepID=A0AAV4RES8_9ARAC|nr:hypothetical protein CDAR_113851 [Caerostris darwini]
MIVGHKLQIADRHHPLVAISIRALTAPNKKSLTTTTNCKSKNRAEIPTTDYKTGEKTKRESTGHMIPKSLLLR